MPNKPQVVTVDDRCSLHVVSLGPQPVAVRIFRPFCEASNDVRCRPYRPQVDPRFARPESSVILPLYPRLARLDEEDDSDDGERMILRFSRTGHTTCPERK